jgi:hypothetical protein
MSKTRKHSTAKNGWNHSGCCSPPLRRQRTRSVRAGISPFVTLSRSIRVNRSEPSSCCRDIDLKVCNQTPHQSHETLLLPRPQGRNTVVQRGSGGTAFVPIIKPRRGGTWQTHWVSGDFNLRYQISSLKLLKILNLKSPSASQYSLKTWEYFSTL